MRIGSFEKKRMLTITFLGLGLIIFNAAIAFGGADKSPSVNLFGHSSPATPFPSWWCIFWDEHIDWQTTGKTNYYTCATRNQPVGTYELCIRWALNRLPWLYAFYDSNSVHRDSGIAHVKVNSYYYPDFEVVGTSRLLPGWDPVNDVNGNWVRDKKADYDYNNDTTRFTVTYTPDYIEDAGGGQMGTWTANEWQRDYVKMGWGLDADTVAFRVDSNTTTRLYLNGDIPSHTYTWFIVDDSDAVNHNAVAMTDSLARIRTGWWTGNLINIKHWLAKAFVGRFFHNLIHTDLLGREPTDIYMDDVPKTAPSWATGSGWADNWTMGGICLEGLDDDDIYRPYVREYLRQIKDSLGSINFLIVNALSTHPGWDTIVYGGSVSGLWHEGWINTSTPRGDFNDKFNAFKKWTNSPYNIKLHFVQALGGGQGYGDLIRNKIGALSWYYIYKGDSTYFLFDTEPYYGTALGDTTTWWFGLMGVDIGTPTDTAVEVLENGAYVWKRSFSKGYVIHKPKPSSSSNYTDVTVHTLPKYYYRLDVNGNIVGDSVNQVSLRNSEGVILLSTGGSQSQILPPQPLSPQNGATVDTTQPTLIIQNTQDPEGRPLLYYFELDTVTQFNSQAKKESNSFELETGQDSTKWTVPTPLSSGIYYWRSRAYTNTYPSDTSQTSTVYHFQLSTAIGDSIYSLYLHSPVGDELIITLRPTLNAQFIHNSFDRERIRVKFEISEEASFSTGRTILSPYVNIPENLSIFWTTDRDLKEGKRYFWRVNVYDFDLLVAISDPGSFFTGSIHVFPNPFKPSQGDSFITFRNIPLYSKIIITTLSGELVRELSGNTSTDVVWDVKNQQGKSLASGAYYYRVDFPSGSTSGKLAIIK